MGGQVLGGGVIVLVAALLWLVYLLPSWASRRQYDAAERNAVRLNQALRVLAETSETPEEVRLELNARTALAQQRLARRALVELLPLDEGAALAQQRLARRALVEREELAKRTQAERDQAGLEEARVALAVARDQPAARRARARRRARLLTTTIGLVAVGLLMWGAFSAAWGLLTVGLGLIVVSAVLLRRMARVGRRVIAGVAVSEAAVRTETALQDVALADERSWAPRELPRPLTASAGSRAAAVLDAAEARDALREAALEESLRARTEAERPPSIAAARRARASETASSRIGSARDDEIEAHVRQLLERRAVGG